MQAAPRPHTGPLDLPVSDAGRLRGEDRLQRAITLQLEETRRDVLHAHIRALPVTDPRRQAWMSAGRGSRQWVTSHPTERMDLDGHGGQDFHIVIATYLGRECPVSRLLARDGLALAGPPGGADIPVDAHGHELGGIRKSMVPVSTFSKAFRWCHYQLSSKLSRNLLKFRSRKKGAG